MLFWHPEAGKLLLRVAQQGIRSGTVSELNKSESNVERWL